MKCMEDSVWRIYLTLPSRNTGNEIRRIDGAFGTSIVS